MAQAEEMWKELLNGGNVDPNNNVMQPVIPHVQAAWDAPLYEFAFKQLLDDQTAPVEQARLRSAAAEHSSDWLNAIPVPSLGLKMDNTSVRIATGLRLGSRLCEPYKCVCGQLTDPHGHDLSCKNAKGTYSRHSQANDIIKRALASAGVPSVLEPNGLS